MKMHLLFTCYGTKEQINGHYCVLCYILQFQVKQENPTIGKMVIYTFHKCDFLKLPPLWDFVYSVT